MFGNSMLGNLLCKYQHDLPLHNKKDFERAKIGSDSDRIAFLSHTSTGISYLSTGKNPR